MGGNEGSERAYTAPTDPCNDAPEVAHRPPGVVAEAVRLDGLRLQPQGAVSVRRAAAPRREAGRAGEARPAAVAVASALGVVRVSRPSSLDASVWLLVPLKAVLDLLPVPLHALAPLALQRLPPPAGRPCTHSGPSR